MNLLFLNRSLASVCLALSVGLSSPVFAQAKDEVPMVADSAEVSEEPSGKAALTLARGVDGADEPFYAGTSTWFLLSIALLGSIAVQRRTDVVD